jgi:RimJ/RimL family protein N-acetyltransferase
MLSYVFGQHEVVGKFISDRIPHNGGHGLGGAKTIGIIDGDGRLIGAVAFGNWDPVAKVIEVAGASISPRWLTRRTIQVIYDYPFKQLGCQMIYQRTPIDNERLLRQLAVGGYSFIKVPRMFGRDRDGVLCMLTCEDWERSKFIRRPAPALQEAA